MIKPSFEKESSGKKVGKYIPHPINLTTLVARPLVLQGKLFLRFQKSEKYMEFKMKPNIQFRKMLKNVHLKFAVIQYVIG
jgi:hypothetical protein